MKKYILFFSVLSVTNSYADINKNCLADTQTNTYNCSFSGSGDGLTQKINDALKSSVSYSNVVLEIKAGKYVLEPVHVTRNNVKLLLDSNTILTAIPKSDSRWSGAQISATYPHHQALILISSVKNFILTGQSNSIIDGNGSDWWGQDKGRPVLINIENSTNSQVSNLKLQNSPRYNLSLQHDNQAEIYGLNITAPTTSPNTDGVNMWGVQNINIHDISVKNGDDGIAINTFDAPSSNITIKNVNLSYGHGVSIGSRVLMPVTNVHISDVALNNSDNGLRIKTYCKNPNCSDTANAYVSDISYTDIKMNQIKNPIVYNLKYHVKGGYSQVKLHDISYTNVTATNSGKPAELRCGPQNQCMNISFKNVSIDSGSVCRNVNNLNTIKSGPCAGINN